MPDAGDSSTYLGDSGSTISDDKLDSAGSSSESDSDSGSDSSSSSGSESDSASNSDSDSSDLPPHKSTKKKRAKVKAKSKSRPHTKKAPSKANSAPSNARQALGTAGSRRRKSKASKDKNADKENAQPQSRNGRRISQYELEREQNITQNQALWGEILASDPRGLGAVGLAVENGRLIHTDDTPSAPITRPKAKCKRTTSLTASSARPRKSACLSGAEVQADEEMMDNSPDADIVDPQITNFEAQPAPDADGSNATLPAPPQVSVTNSLAPDNATGSFAVNPISNPQLPSDQPHGCTPSQPLDSAAATIPNDFAGLPSLDSFAPTIIPFEPSADVANWLRKPLAEISKIALSPDFYATLNLLCKLERKYAFVNKTRGYPKDRRPKLLNDWVGDGRG